MRLTKYPEYRDSGIRWLGLIPSHWRVKKLKHFCSVFPSNVDKHARDGERAIRLCNYTDVYYNDQITAEMPFMEATATDDQIAKFSLRAGDTIITKDSESADDIAVSAYVPEDLPGVICGYHLSMVRPNGEISGSFVKRLFDSRYAKSRFAVSANGLTRVGLGQYALDNVEFPLPPMEEQSDIAAFLDRETAKIDTLIAEQERLLELLDEKRQAVISHAVTKGLNPDAPMKDSGVKWLGEVPAHWNVKAIKWLSPVFRGASPRPIDDAKYFDDEGEFAWVRIADSSASDGILQETTQRLSELGSSLSVKIYPGQLFVSIAGTVGKPCIAGIKCCIHDGFVYFPRLPIRAEFLFRIFEDGACYAGLGKMGTQLNLNTDTIGSIRIAVPPSHEIDAILAFIDERCREVDALRREVQSATSLLAERRSALIAAAVTGQIDVREAA